MIEMDREVGNKTPVKSKRMIRDYSDLYNSEETSVKSWIESLQQEYEILYNKNLDLIIEKQKILQQFSQLKSFFKEEFTALNSKVHQILSDIDSRLSKLEEKTLSSKSSKNKKKNNQTSNFRCEECHSEFRFIGDLIRHQDKIHQNSKKRNEIFALFWDFENVSLRHNNWQDFISGLQNFIKQNSISVAKCFYRDKFTSNESKTKLRSIQHLKFKRVTGTEKNAVDNSIINSCRNLIRNRLGINHVILVTGDGDFIPLIHELQDKGIKVSIICSLKNSNREMLNLARIYSIFKLSENPSNWWKCDPSLNKKMGKII